MISQIYTQILLILRMQATLEKALITTQPNTEKSFFLSQMNGIECTFLYVAHISYWHCPYLLGNGWGASFLNTLYMVK